MVGRHAEHERNDMSYQTFQTESRVRLVSEFTWT